MEPFSSLLTICVLILGKYFPEARYFPTFPKNSAISEIGIVAWTMGKKSLEKNDVWNGFPKKYIGPYMHKKISLMGYFLNRISLSPQKFVFYIFLLIKTGFPENNEGIAHNSETYVHSHTKTPTEKPTQTETTTDRRECGCWDDIVYRTVQILHQQIILKQ